MCAAAAAAAAGADIRYETEVELPGPSRLEIQVIDRDWAGDEYIGTTVLDLEARDPRLCPQWRRSIERHQHAPVERITLRQPGVALGQGILELWVDIFDLDRVKTGELQSMGDDRPRNMCHARFRNNPAQFRAFQRVPEQFQLRVAILRTEDMHTMDSGNHNDLYISAELVTLSADGTARTSTQKKTSTHERAGTNGSFNEWLVFDLELFYAIPTMPASLRQPQRLVLKAWDSDLLGSDLIGSYDSASDPSGVLDVDTLFETALSMAGKKHGKKKQTKRNQKGERLRLPPLVRMCLVKASCPVSVFGAA